MKLLGDALAPGKGPAFYSPYNALKFIDAIAAEPDFGFHFTELRAAAFEDNRELPDDIRLFATARQVARQWLRQEAARRLQ